MSKLIWKKLTRFGTDTHHYSGIYKISSYIFNSKLKTVERNKEVPRYYQVYILAATNWGDYVDKVKQETTMMTLTEAQALAQAHHDKHGEPDPFRLETAQKAIDRFMEPQLEWLEKNQ